MKDKLDPIELPVTGRVTGDTELIGGPAYDANRSILSMGTVSSKEGATARLQLVLQGVHREGAEPKVVSIHPEGALQVEIGSSRDTAIRRMFPVVFTVPKGAPPVTYAGSNPKNFAKVVIKPAENSAEVPIYIRLVVTE